MTRESEDKSRDRESSTPATNPKTVDGERADRQRVSSGDRMSNELDDVVRLVARSPSRTPASEPLPGTRWGASGRYVIQRRVGAGGMGTVYEATDELLGRVVALKVLHRASDEEDQANRDAILREARLGSRVEYERIARVYDVGEHEGQLFVAMEFVRGMSLRAFIKRSQLAAYYRLPGVLNLVLQIAEGLAELHTNGVTHGDLKPENVMFSEHGIKLVDFGLARSQTPSLEMVQTATFGENTAGLGGTLGYMAPEQLSGRALDPQVDVFALGVIVYELVTGTRPFVGDRPLDLLEAMESPPVFLPDDWNEDESNPHHHLGLRLREVTRRMLSRNPQKRFADGAGVELALRFAGRPPGKRSLDLAEAIESMMAWTARRGAAARDILWVDDEPETSAREIHMFHSIGMRATVVSHEMAYRHLMRGRSACAVIMVRKDEAQEHYKTSDHRLVIMMRKMCDRTPVFRYSNASPIEYKRWVEDLGVHGCTNDCRKLLEMVTCALRGEGERGILTAR